MLDTLIEEGHILILNSFTKTIFGWGWSWWLSLVIVVAIVGIVAIRIGRNAGNYNWLISGIIITFFAVVGGVCVSSNARTVDTYEAYEIIMDDCVPFREFNEVYEVIDHRGDIYTVRLKEAGD